MKIAILEDTYYFQNKIRNYIPKEHIVHIYSNVEEYNQSHIYYDLLLLDIKLNQDNGIEYIRKNAHKQMYIVYLSNYEEYMIDTFDTNVLGFIPKNKIDNLLESKIQWVQTKIQRQNQIILSVPGEKIILKENDILLFYVQEGNIFVVLENKKKYRLVYETLKEVQTMVSNSFLRVKSNCIVNGTKIKKLDVSNHVIDLDEQIKIRVSKRKWKEIKNKYIELKMDI